MSDPSVVETVVFAPGVEQVGTVIAQRYKLLEQIGEGGMGTVWVAEQTLPVRRKVALKLIKAGMDSKSVLSRFEAERQALAVMDHANIAKVLDGGTTENGRPFFVMEYVKGIAITEYCDSVRLKVDERLQLFVQVCSAVQHAHQKGIIHRDLKPSNILVAPYDDKLVPKIIDFGLAKAMYQPLTDKTLHTGHETVLGTPLYMSPEQAQLNNLDVDTRSDIYSLGVLLYELLTGTTPLERKRFKEAAWDEIKRIIREEDPPRPSVRLSSTDTLPSLAACRQSEPLALTKQIRGELDWIVMKALEKDRNRRYETANAFAADVQRFLSGEPVQAVPASTGYRLRKFLCKHQNVVVGTVTVGLTLVLATAISLWQAARAQSAAASALNESIAAKRARDEERTARLDEAAARDRAEKAEKLAVEAGLEEQRARQAAEADRDAKLLALIRADGLRLSAEAAAARQSDPGLSLLLAIEAVRKVPNHLTYAVLYDALATCNEQQVLSEPMRKIDLARFCSDGKRILAAGSLTPDLVGRRQFDGAVCAWSSVTGQLESIWKGLESPISNLDISPSGRQVALAIQGSCLVTFPPEHKPPRALFTDRVVYVFDPQSGNELIHLRRHDDRVVSVRFNSDGTKLVTASWDQTARIWDAATGNMLHVLRGHDCSLRQAIFSPDGKQVLTLTSNRLDSSTHGEDRDVELAVDSGVMDLSDASFQRGIDSTGSANFTGEEKIARIWDVETGSKGVSLLKKRPGAFVFGHVWHPISACFSGDGKQIGVAFTEDIAAVWDAASGGSEQFLLRGHVGEVTDIVFSPQSRRIATAGIDRKARVWDATTGKELLVFVGHRDAVRSVRFSPDGKQLLSASIDGTARLWDTVSGEELAVFRGHSGTVLSTDFFASTHQILTAGDSTARVFMYPPPPEVCVVLRGHTGSISALEFSPDGQRLLTAAEDETPRIWDCASEKNLLVIGTDKMLGAIRSAQFVEGGTRVLTGSGHAMYSVNGRIVNSSAVHVWDSRTGADLFSLDRHETGAFWALESRDGTLMMTANDGAVRHRSKSLISTYFNKDYSLLANVVRVWNAKNGTLQATLPKGIPNSTAQFSPDGLRVLMITEPTRQVCLFDAKSGAELLKLSNDSGTPIHATFNSDGDRIIVLATGQSLIVYDAKDGRRIQKTELPIMNVELVGIQPAGRRIVATANTKAIIWDLHESRLVSELKSHEGRLRSAIFSPDGRSVATASDDHTAALWDAETGRMVSLYKGHTGPIVRLAFSPDGKRLATGSADSTARIWPSDLWPAILNRRTRTLTSAEISRYDVK